VIAGIDLGTQGVKVFLLDPHLRITARGFAPYPTRHPRPGWAEQDPAAWEQAVVRAVRQALAEAGVGPQAVRAVGVTGQLDGCVAVGADGRALYPCLIWMDRRARLELEPGIALRLREEGGVVPDPGHLAAKVRWLQGQARHEAPTAARAACFHQPVSYLVQRLTGEQVWDHGLASISMLYSLRRGGYETDFLAAFGVSTAELPRIARAEEAAGRLSSEGADWSGLPAGVPVAVGSGDDFCSPLGAGVLEPGRVACVSGTAEVVGALSDEPVIDPRGLVETHCYPGGRYFVENPGWLSGGAVSWFAATCGLGESGELERRAAAAPPGADGVLFLPALSGSMAPEWNPAARGCFYGLTAAHHAGHLARAVLEGCAFAMRDVIERLRELAVPADRIVLMGGGARSRTWAGIRADVSGLPVFRVREVDTAPIGAAMLAAVAAGLYPDLAVCAAELPGGGEEVAPESANRPAYQRAYAAYRKLFESLRPMFASEEGP
jgi:xylulokinase